MFYIQQGVAASNDERKRFRHAPRFTPAGQSTQMIVGASNESDHDILRLSDALYQRPSMKRVYYSGYIPVNTYDNRLPALKQPPLVREHRLYQADWMMRFYGFGTNEIVNDNFPNLELEIDPKLSWALRHPEFFPVDIHKADQPLILRVPGIGLKSATLIMASRKHGRITASALAKMGVVMKKARYFITCGELPLLTINEVHPEAIRRALTAKKNPKHDADNRQLSIPFPE